jgi:glycosyltransferase involved in cell wall biosynthesis
MKILYLIDTLEIGGSEHSLCAILQHIRRIKPIVCHIYPGETLKPHFETAGVRVISLNIAGKYAFRRAVSQVCSLIQAEQPDLVHTTLFRADVVGRTVGKLTRVPVISSFVSEPYHTTRWQALSPTGRVKLKAVQLLDRLTALWTRHFVATSQSAKSANCRALAIPTNKVSVIYRGRGPAPFLDVSEVQVAALRLALALPMEALVLLNVARILQHKGQVELLFAMPLVLKHFPETQLLIVGEGQGRPMLEQIIVELRLGHAVRLVGNRNDIPTLLHISNLFVFPSHYEGHPGALLEAMLAGRPIVASDIPVHREMITNGETGLLVPFKNPEALARAILQVLGDPSQAKKMGERARMVAIERFDINHIARQYENLYERLCRAGGCKQ